MEGSTTAAVNAAGSSQGISAGAGQPGATGQDVHPAAGTGTLAPAENSQASPQATPSEQPPVQGGTPKRLFNDLDSAEREYKAIQSRVTKAEQVAARFGDLNAAEQRLQLLDQLQTDPKFIEWAKARLAEADTGRGDPETQQALQIVEAVTERKARELIAPLVARDAQMRLAGIWQAMEGKYGKAEWQEAQPKMATLFQRGLQAGYFHPTANTNVSLEFVDALYRMTLDDETAAKQYAKRVAQKQAASTSSTPGTAPTAVAPAPVSSVRDAWALAKKQAGIA